MKHTQCVLLFDPVVRAKRRLLLEAGHHVPQRNTLLVPLEDEHAIVNRQIVRAGFAWRYEQYAKHDNGLRDAERQARVARLGLWADPRPVPPWEWRRARSAVRR